MGVQDHMLVFQLEALDELRQRVLCLGHPRCKGEYHINDIIWDINLETDDIAHEKCF
jgi:hypothetical protein